MKEGVLLRHPLLLCGHSICDRENNLQLTDLDIPEPDRVSMVLETDISLFRDTLRKTREVFKFAVPD